MIKRCSKARSSNLNQNQNKSGDDTSIDLPSLRFGRFDEDGEKQSISMTDPFHPHQQQQE